MPTKRLEEMTPKERETHVKQQMETRMALRKKERMEAKALYKASRRLRLSHPDEFKAYLLEERALLGLRRR